jgi:hypothetical protein
MTLHLSPQGKVLRRHIERTRKLRALLAWWELAACRRIGLLIADVQHENPRGVGKGRLLTRSGLTVRPLAALQEYIERTLPAPSADLGQSLVT